MMKGLFIKNRSEQNRNRSKLNIVMATFLAVVFLVTTAPLVEAQSSRIPAPGPSGNFGDIQVDGDRVKILTINDGGKPGKVQIKLDADSTWWKMLRVYDKNGRTNYVEQENGRYLNKKDVIEIDSKNLNDTFRLEFWKAKLFGVHTYIMTEIYRKQDFEGRVIKFVWKEGLESSDSDLSPDMTAPINETIKIDGKDITIRSSDGGRKGYATIKFHTDVDWWTAVKFFDRNGVAKLIEKVDGRYSPSNKTLEMPISSFPSEVTLEFWTAKLLGVYTQMASKKLIRERFDGRMVTINWGNPVVPINETVKIEGKNVIIRSSDNGTQGYVTVKFQTNLDWWTAVKFFDRNGKAKLIEKVNGRYNPGSQTLKIPINNFSSNITLEIWTAKLFGVHTQMASKVITSERFDGRTVTITWNK
jgi:hypothetical protein